MATGLSCAATEAALFMAQVILAGLALSPGSAGSPDLTDNPHLIQCSLGCR